jgi:hypothetical protein
MAATLLGASIAGRSQSPAPPLFLPGWDRTFTARASGGYKDNLTYAHLRPESSPFVSAGADALVSWTSFENAQVTGMLSADELRYLGSASVDHERFILGQAQVKKSLWTGFEASFAADYLYQDRVLDLSATETNRQAIFVRNHVITARPRLKMDLPCHNWVAFEWEGSRQLFAAPLDNFWEYGPRFTLAHDYRYGSQVGLSYGIQNRDYDRDAQLTPEGAPIPGAQRRFEQHDVRLAWRHYWDSRQHWRTTTRLGYKVNEDQGPGFFDYTRLSASQQIRLRLNPTWDLSLDARLARYAFGVQQASAADPGKLERTELALSLRCERALTRWLKLVGACEHERAWSNDPFERYTANTVSAGLEAEF